MKNNSGPPSKVKEHSPHTNDGGGQWLNYRVNDLGLRKNLSIYKQLNMLYSMKQGNVKGNLYTQLHLILSYQSMYRFSLGCMNCNAATQWILNCFVKWVMQYSNINKKMHMLWKHPASYLYSHILQLLSWHLHRWSPASWTIGNSEKRLHVYCRACRMNGCCGWMGLNFHPFSRDLLYGDEWGWIIFSLQPFSPIQRNSSTHSAPFIPIQPNC